MESDQEWSTRAALTTIAETRSAAANRLVSPWWYHPILGLLLAGDVVAFSFGNTVVQLVATLLLLIGVAILVRAYTRRTGVWISGFDAGPASRWAYLMGAAAAVAMISSLIIAQTTSLVWPTWCIAGALVIAVIVLGHRFDTAVRDQLRAGV